MGNTSSPLDMVNAVGETTLTRAANDVEMKTQNDEESAVSTPDSDPKEESTHVAAPGDADDAVPERSTIIFVGDDDNGNSIGKRSTGMFEARKAPADASDIHSLGHAFEVLDLSAFHDTKGIDIYENEAINASENTGLQGKPTGVPGTDDLCDASTKWATSEARSSKEAQNLEKNKVAAPGLPSDIFVPLRPEGVFAEDDPNDTSLTSRVRFTDEATLRGYERGSRPSPTFQPSSPQVLDHRATGFAHNNTASDLELDQAADSVDKRKLTECEEELVLLEHTLPEKSQDPNSVKFTRLVIESARDAVKKAHEAMREGCEYEEPVDFALYMTVRAHGFHEEALRLVNGRDKSSDINEFERRILYEDECREKMRNRHAGALPDDYFDDVPDA